MLSKYFIISLLLTFSLFGQSRNFILLLSGDDAEKFDVYASTLGNDSYDGLTIRTPKLTLSGANSLLNGIVTAKGSAKLGLLSYGKWREQLTSTVNNLTIKGVNGLAKIYGTDVITGWALTSGKTYTYEKSVSHSITSLSVNRDYNNILVTEVTIADTALKPYTSKKPMTLATSVDNCEATAGSYFYTVANPSIVYIHPTNNQAPNHGEYFYEVTTRDNCINPSAGSSFTYYNTTFENLYLFSSGAGYGMASGGLNTHVKRVAFQNGGIHCMVFNSGILEESLVLGAATTSSQFAFYKEDATGLNTLVKNSIFLDATPMIMHTSGDYAKRHNKLTVNNVQHFGSIGSWGGDVDSVIADKVYANGASLLGGNARIYSGSNSIIYNGAYLYYNNSPTELPATVTLRNCLSLDTTNSNNGGSFYSNYKQKYWNVYNTTIIKKLNSPNSEIFDFIVDATTYDNMLATVKNCLIVNTGLGMSAYSTNKGGLSTPTSLNVIADSNVFIGVRGVEGITTNTDGVMFNIYNPTEGRIDFSRWQISTGQDLNSIFIRIYQPSDLNTIFYDYKHGDLRLRPTSYYAKRIYDLRAGMTTPPTSLPTKPTYEEAVANMVAGNLATLNDNLLPSSYTPTFNSFDSDTALYFGRLVTPISEAQRTRLKTVFQMLHDSLHTTNINTRFKTLYLIANETHDAGNKNLAQNRFDLLDWSYGNNTSYPLWTQWEGYSKGTANNYIRNGELPFVDSTVQRWNNASQGIYITKYLSTDSKPDIWLEIATATTYYSINGVSNSRSTGADTVGLFSTNLTSATNLEFYINGTKVKTTSVTNPILSINQYRTLLCGNNNYTGNYNPYQNFNGQVAIAWSGGSFTATEQRALKNIFEWYMDSLGKGVIP